MRSVEQKFGGGLSELTPFYVGKTVLVAEAEHPLAQLVVHLLAQLGSIVIALGRDAELMHEIASFAPDKIQPLALDLSDLDHVDHFTKTWADEPLHLLSYFCPLNIEREAYDGITPIIRLMTGIAGGLRAGDGSAVIVTEPLSDTENYDIAARHGALSTLVPRMSRDLKIHISGLILPSINSLDQTSGILDTILMVGLPQSRRLSGVVLPLLPTGE